MTAGYERLAVSLDVSAIPARPAGAGRYVVELARVLGSSEALALTLVARRSDGARWRQLAPSSTVLAIAPDSRPWRVGFEQALLGPAIGRAGPPAIRVHHGPHYTLPRRLGGVPAVVTVHDMTFFDHPEWHEKAKVPFFRQAIKRSATRADVIICVSELTAERLKALLAPVGAVAVIPHGVDHRRFRPAGGPEEAELDAVLVTQAGVGGSTPYILHLGTNEPRKGVADLLGAFNLVAPDVPELELVLAGLTGWGSSGVEAAIEASPFGSRIRRLGYVADESVPALLRRAAVVAYPSYEEGFGLPALEALACGAPLVTTSATAMSEVAGDSAWTCPAGEPEALAGALVAALGASASERARRQDSGVARAGSFTWDRTAEAHVAAYRLASG
ncbi:MAG: glycosyltransferase family 4 protein [Acidimicrobiales bacterium]